MISGFVLSNLVKNIYLSMKMLKKIRLIDVHHVLQYISMNLTLVVSVKFKKQFIERNTMAVYEICEYGGHATANYNYMN